MDSSNSANDPKSTPLPPEPITFKQFATLARRRGHTPESLADRFRGKIENPAEFFGRVMSCRYKGEDRSEVVIPYRSVVTFYARELHYFGDSNEKHRRCGCGCGQAVFDRKKWVSDGHKKRFARRRFTDKPNGVQQVADLIDARPGQIRQVDSLPQPAHKPGRERIQNRNERRRIPHEELAD
jgi:hypothetical protein